MRKFEFHAYKGDEFGAIAERAEVETKEFAETAQAKAYAGRLARRVNGPVDIARAFDPPAQPTRDWGSRYITTANPSSYHASGFRFERIS